jgi:methyltransferase (TIGR00027 family)
VTRAGFTRPHTPGGDPDAQRRLCRGMPAVTLTEMGPSLAARTRFFDDQVLASISAGVGQIVILGAGYDDRALRFRSAGVRFFELDHPATQADKARRLRALQADASEPRLVPADFRHDDVAAVLGGCGHDATRPSLFICEGLLVYLEQSAIAGLLAGLRSAAAAGSTLAASLAVHREGPSSEQVTAIANARRRNGTSEPWRTILPAAAHIELVEQAGWHVSGTVDAARLDPGAPPGRSLLITAEPGTMVVPGTAGG